MEYIWKCEYPSIICEYQNINSSSKEWQGIIYKLYAGKYGRFVFKIPLYMQFDIQAIHNYLFDKIEELGYIDTKKAMWEFQKLYTKENIDNFHKVEEIEYKHYKENLKPYILAYTTGKIGGNGFFKGCELKLYTLNKEYEVE